MSDDIGEGGDEGHCHSDVTLSGYLVTMTVLALATANNDMVLFMMAIMIAIV